MAGRYATALFELALDDNALDAVRADLDRFDAAVAQSADLARLVRSPVFSAKEQVRALTAVLELIGLRGLSGYHETTDKICSHGGSPGSGRHCWGLAEFQWQFSYRSENTVSLDARSYNVGVGNAQYGSPGISSGPAYTRAVIFHQAQPCPD